MPTTWNPADKDTNITLSNGDLTVSKTATGWGSVRATTSKATGKWYWEVKIDSGGSGSSTFLFVGVGKATADITNFCGSDADGWGYLNIPARRYNNNLFNAYGATWGADNDVIGVLWDADAGTLEFEKNDVSQGVAFASGVTGTIFPMLSANSDSISGYFVTGHFSADQLIYALPAGYSAIGGSGDTFPAGYHHSQNIDTLLRM